MLQQYLSEVTLVHFITTWSSIIVSYTHLDVYKRQAFKEMLDEDANKDYALNELAYIQKLREIM